MTPQTVFDDLASNLREKCQSGHPGFKKWCDEYKSRIRSVQLTGSRNQPATKPNAAQAKPRGLGDAVESALKLVGITEERVSKWLGSPCGCSARKAKLNSLSDWAIRVASGSRELPPIS